MAILDQAQREKYATIGKDRYPINDKNHARLALAYINKGNLSLAQKQAVIQAAHAKLAGK